MTATVSVRDNGYKGLIGRLSKPSTVTVGVHMAEGSEQSADGDITVAEIAAIHEFGLGVPERSWLRDFVDENRDEIHQLMRRAGREIAAGMEPEKAMARFGLVIVGKVKERIIAGIDPPLAEVTKIAKQRKTRGGPKDTPLILFGQLISAIAHEVNK